MTIDLPTLMITGAFLALMSGALLLLARVQYSDTRAVSWWAAAHFVNAVGVGAMAFSGNPPAAPLIFVAFPLLTLAPSLVWSAARRLNDKSAPHAVVFGAPALVLIAPLISPLPALATLGLLAALLAMGFLLATAFTLMFQATAPLLSRWPLAFLCVLHAVALILTGPLQIPPDRIPGWLYPVFALIHFESLVYFLGTAIFVVAWMRESSEQRHKAAADTDPITGLASRRAFFASAERMLERCRVAGTPCAVLVFDLDYFKTINDTHGHAVGDRVLETFGAVLNRTMRPHDIGGRIGGEEFAAIASGSNIFVGIALADRVRKAFAEAAGTVDGLAIGGTLSAGVSATSGAEDLSAILKRADAALYRAKMRGRNRVEAMDAGEPAEVSNVVRIA